MKKFNKVSLIVLTFSMVNSIFAMQFTGPSAQEFAEQLTDSIEFGDFKGVKELLNTGAQPSQKDVQHAFRKVQEAQDRISKQEFWKIYEALKQKITKE